MNRRTEVTFDDLKAILAECAGEDDDGGGGLAGASPDTPFADLGYDSLAVLESAAVVARRTGAVLADDLFAETRTPREFLDLVRAALDGPARTSS